MIITSSKPSYSTIPTCVTPITIDPVSSLVRVDKIPVFRAYTRNGILYVQFKDGNKLRSDYRGCDTVEIPFDKLHDYLLETCC